MKKPKKGDIVIMPENFIWPHLPTDPKEYKVLSIGEFGYYIEVPHFSSGRYYIGYDDNWNIKQKDYSQTISLIFAIVIILLLLFSSFYFKL